MAIRTILHYPDKRLREKGVAIPSVTPEIKQLIDDMAETMYAAPGVGLAATQIGAALQLFVIDVAGDNEPSDLRVFINPEIVERNGCIDWQEGCLSFPGVTEDVVAPILAQASGLEAGVDFLQKPFSLSDLAFKVRAALDDRGGP